MLPLLLSHQPLELHESRYRNETATRMQLLWYGVQWWCFAVRTQKIALERIGFQLHRMRIRGSIEIQFENAYDNSCESNFVWGGKCNLKLEDNSNFTIMQFRRLEKRGSNAMNVTNDSLWKVIVISIQACILWRKGRSVPSIAINVLRAFRHKRNYWWISLIRSRRKSSDWPILLLFFFLSQKHSAKFHKDPGQFDCPICPKNFPNKILLEVS